MTAYIPSPWGFGQFRPAVVIPSLFAVIFGPLPSGVGAALGTLIADSVKHGYLYEGSLIAAVPGNFIGFYLFGYIVKRRFSWGRFVLASNLTLAVANLIVATLYVFIFKVLYLGQLPLTLDALIFMVVGLTIWWFVTMLPFVLLVTPPLIRAVAYTSPAVVPEDVKTHSLQKEMPRKMFSLALLLPGTIMLLMGMATSYTTFGTTLVSFFGAITKDLIQIMFYGSGIVMLILGLFILVIKK